MADLPVVVDVSGTPGDIRLDGTQRRRERDHDRAGERRQLVDTGEPEGIEPIDGAADSRQGCLGLLTVGDPFDRH